MPRFMDMPKVVPSATRRRVLGVAHRAGAVDVLVTAGVGEQVEDLLGRRGDHPLDRLDVGLGDGGAHRYSDSWSSGGLAPPAPARGLVALDGAVVGGVLYDGDHPRLHELGRAHDLAGAGDLGDLDDAPTGADVDSPARPGGHHFICARASPPPTSTTTSTRSPFMTPSSPIPRAAATARSW